MTRTPHPTPTSHAPRYARLLVLLTGALLAALLLPLAPSAPAADSLPLEPYAQYQEPDRCTPTVKPGTRILSRWLIRHYGSSTTMSRACEWGEHVTSEHQEGRAIDWFADAETRKGIRAARTLIDDLLAPDQWGNQAVRARRMGIMYIIWNDRMYSAWREFRPVPYLHSSCKSREKCSKTLRHRDHVHISLTRRAAAARTSWFLMR